MSIPPSRSYRHGLRGRHKHSTSPETRAWEQISGTAWLANSAEPENAQADGHVDPSQADSVAPVASIPAAPPFHARHGWTRPPTRSCWS